RVFEECLADLCPRVDGAEYVATGAMIVTRDRAERFALSALAAARRAEKDKRVVSHHQRNPLILQKAPARQALSSQVKSRGPRRYQWQFNGIFRPRKLSGLKMTKRPADRRSPAAHRDRSARCRQEAQKLCSRDPGRHFSPVKTLCRAGAR